MILASCKRCALVSDLTRAELINKYIELDNGEFKENKTYPEYAEQETDTVWACGYCNHINVSGAEED